MNAGDVLIRDPRCLHRGSPNKTDVPRIVAVIGATRSWMWRGPERLRESSIDRDVWEGLSDEQRPRLQHFQHYVV